MFINNQDLLKEISLTQLLQMSDLNHTGGINQEVINDCISDTLSFIESFFLIPANPTPLIKNIAIRLTILELKRKNELISDEDKKDKKELESYLIKISKGTLPKEIIPNAPTPQKNSSFTFRHKKSRLNLKGFS